EGQIETGMTIQFRALGTIEKPSLVNVNTQEELKINKSMAAGEVITVNTRKGQKRIESILNGVVNNVFNSIKPGSIFLQLRVGDNLFRYDAESGIDNLEVTIYYRNQYIGV
ncbi:phage tail protein, partial [Bacillus manliponensis]